jgi:muramoyltetrapeptide carboxypeptidase
MAHSFIKPKPLRPGGTIGVVAPCGKVELDNLARGIALLAQRGFKILSGRHLAKGHRYFAGSDRDRADDFLEMMRNDAVDAIICARGGSGAARILPYLNQAGPLPAKIVVGLSDITTLLLYLSEKHHLVTFHGPMVATQFGKMPASPVAKQAEDNLFRILSGEAVSFFSPKITVLQPGRADGLLTGGCLTLICTTIGTSYEIDTNDRILFIEDINEAPYRIDRMLYYLKTVKKLDKIKGLIIGEMPDCHPHLLPEIILEFFADADFPILFGFPSGHGEAIFTLPFGTPVHLDATTDVPTLTMLDSAVSE